MQNVRESLLLSTTCPTTSGTAMCWPQTKQKRSFRGDLNIDLKQLPYLFFILCFSMHVAAYVCVLMCALPVYVYTYRSTPKTIPVLRTHLTMEDMLPFWNKSHRSLSLKFLAFLNLLSKYYMAWQKPANTVERQWIVGSPALAVPVHCSFSYFSSSLLLTLKYYSFLVPGAPPGSLSQAQFFRRQWNLTFPLLYTSLFNDAGHFFHFPWQHIYIQKVSSESRSWKLL